MQLGRIGVRRDGYRPEIIVPDAWYSTVTRAMKVLAAVDVLVAIVGAVAAVLGIPFGAPLFTLAVTLLLLIEIGRRVIVRVESEGLHVGEPSISVTQSCPECGTELGEKPDTCGACSWTAGSPAKA